MDAKIKDILVETLCSEWKRFAYGTGLNLVIIEYIDLNEGSNKIKLESFLTELTKRHPNNFITIVEKSLLEMENINVLKEIQIYYAMERLKLHYLTAYCNFNQQSSQDEPMIDKDIVITDHIELVKVDCMDYKDTLFKDSFNEWESFIKKKNNLKTLTFEEVFASEHPLTLISGIVGIGKTYFLKKCLYLWSNGLIWKNVDFVFYFDLKRFGDFQNISNVNELLKKFYRNILKDVEISSKWSITFLIDGLDQFKFFDKLIYHKLDRLNDIPLVNMLEQTLSSKHTKCILTGRVQAIATYINAFKEEERENVFNIQIRGFSNLGMDYYIENNILVSNLKKDLCKISSTSFEGKSLLSVPLYLKAICSILMSSIHVSVKTVSELQTLVFYYFIKQSTESTKKRKKESIIQLVQDKKEEILEACKVAFILLKKGRVFVSQEEFDSIEHGLHPLGFVEICNITQQYLFTHFIVLKFCASVHLYVCESAKIALNNNRLHLCLPAVSGLECCRDRNFLNVISNIKTVHSKKSWLQEILDFNNEKLFIECLYESQTSLNDYINLSTDKLKELSDSLSGDLKDIAEKYIISKSGDSHKNGNEVSIKRMKNENEVSIKKKNENVVSIEKEKNENVVSIENSYLTKYLNAISLYHKKHFDDAENILKDVENIQNNELGCKHSDTLNTRFWIARCLFDKDQIDNAEVLFTEVKNTQIEVLGENHVNTLDTKYWIGRCLMNKDKSYDAEILFTDVECVQKEILGGNHLKSIETKFWLGRSLYNGDDFDYAEISFREVESMQKQVLGIKHLDTLTTKYWIARCLFDKGQIDNAEILFTEVKNKQIEILGEDHVNILDIKYWIGRCLFDKDQSYNAEILLTEVEYLQTEFFGGNHSKTLETKFWIGRCLYNNDDFDYAEILFTEVENMQKQVLGIKHLDTLKTKYWIARCLWEKGNFNFAENLFREVKNKQIEVLSEIHYKILDTKFWIGICLYDKGEIDNAEILLTEVANKQIVSFGEYHADTLETKHWVGRCFYDNEQYEYAERIFREVKNKRIETLGEYHVDTLETKFWIGRCLYETEQYDYAVRIFREVKNKQRESLGNTHVNTLETMYWIGRCLDERRNFWW